MLISNTSTLILLAKAELLRIFLDDVKQVSIPKIVHKEVFEKKKSFEVLTIKKEIEKKRILLFDVNKKNYLKILKEFKLDKGEAATYSLYKKINGKAILTDDKELIKLCKIENIPFVCAMAIVVRLFQKKKLNDEEAKEKIKKLNGYGRYSKEIYDFFMKKVN